MLAWVISTFFGKVIGLDAIPESKKGEAKKLVLKAIQNSKLTYNPKTGEIGYEIAAVKKEF